MTAKSFCGLVAASMVMAGAASAVSPPPNSLNKCQNTVKTQGRIFVQSYVNAVGTCLQKVSTDLVQSNLATPRTMSANACANQYRKIHDTRGLRKSLVEKLQTKILDKCTPGGSNSHTLQDILGTGATVAHPLDAENLGAWCSSPGFGGNGSIASLQDWVDCIVSAHVCAARAAITAQYPRVLDWLPLVRPVMSSLTPPLGDITKISDAIGGLDADDAAIEGSVNDGIPELGCGVPSRGNPNVVDTSSGTASAGDLASGKKAWVGGVEVTGTAVIATGDAVAANVLSGKTFSNATTAGVTGTMPDNGKVDIMPSASPQTIPAGYHNGLGSVLTDADLVAGNIARGVDIFGVVGAAKLAQVLKTGQTSEYGTESDGHFQKGLAFSYTDNGDGTITDEQTGLMWEKKSHDGSIHDKDNTYTWSATVPQNLDGTLVTTFLNQLNNRCKNNATVTCASDSDCSGVGGPCGFAGHRDWRIPNVKELQSLVNFGAYGPSISDDFNTASACSGTCSLSGPPCSCTSPTTHWTSTTVFNLATQAWTVSFAAGVVDWESKDPNISAYVARAVRGGS